MVTLPHTGRDYLWPSSQTALDLYERLHGRPRQQEIIFNTPIVLYTRKLVADALIDKGYVKVEDGAHFLDLAAFLPVLEEETSWSALGVDQLYGSVQVATTDPTKSNSGSMFSGLLANMLNGAQVVSRQSLPRCCPAQGHIRPAGLHADQLGGHIQPVPQAGRGRLPDRGRLRAS